MKMIMKKVVLLAFLGLFLSMSSYAQHSSRYRSNYRRGQNYNANRFNANLKSFLNRKGPPKGNGYSESPLKDNSPLLL